MTRLGVLGVGDLTEKMIRGLSHGDGAVTQILLSPRNGDKARALAGDLGCTVMSTNQEVVDAADVVMIGVRPAQLQELAQQVTLKPSQPLISVVAGVSVSDLQLQFGTRPCSRAMLSYASEINRSTVAVYPAESVAAQLLSSLGNTVPLATEREFELAMVGACMNGWFYFLVHELQQWLNQKGLPPERARELVLSSIEDCVAYSRHKTPMPIDELGRSIATPGTFTAGGLDVMRQKGSDEAWRAACDYVFSRLDPGER